MITALPFMAALALQAPTIVLPPVLAPAAQGKQQCFSPNAAAKTCASLATYRPTATSLIDSPVDLAVGGTPFVMRTVTSARVVGDRVCGALRAGDIAEAKVLRDGEEESAAQSSQMRLIVTDLWASTLDKDVCTAFATVNGAQVAQAYVNGVRTPAMDQKFIWVTPADGYRAAP